MSYPEELTQQVGFFDEPADEERDTETPETLTDDERDRIVSGEDEEDDLWI